MTATWTNTSRLPETALRADTVRLPKPQPLASPVLITDCATTLAGETVLSLLWKRLDRREDPPL
ncbi:MAG: hypothetical protein KJP02_07005 [Octadecabacter sp.]|nr:hypothetical protein [Octadecabacter sp.]